MSDNKNTGKNKNIFIDDSSLFVDESTTSENKQFKKDSNSSVDSYEAINNKILKRKAKYDDSKVKKQNELFEFVSPMKGKQKNDFSVPSVKKQNITKKYDFLRDKRFGDMTEDELEKYYEFKNVLSPNLADPNDETFVNKKENNNSDHISKDSSSAVNSNIKVDSNINEQKNDGNIISDKKISHEEWVIQREAKFAKANGYGNRFASESVKTDANKEEQQVLHEESFSLGNDKVSSESSFESQEAEFFLDTEPDLVFSKEETDIIEHYGFLENEGKIVQETQKKSSFNKEEDSNKFLYVEEADLDEDDINTTVFDKEREVNESSLPDGDLNETEIDDVADEPEVEINDDELNEASSVINSNNSRVETSNNNARTVHSPKMKKELKPVVEEKKIRIPYVYSRPPMNLLAKNDEEMTVDPYWIEEKSDALAMTFDNFGVGAQVVDYTHGPTVTRFAISLNPGTKVNKITNLQDDIKLALAAKDIRIQAPIPGSSTVGIEIPNQVKHTVFFSDILEVSDSENSKMKLPVSFGLDLEGKPIIKDIGSMPHALIAGATGSGKSVCINTIITSLIYNCSPEDVRLILIDPKMVELAPYDIIPHLLTPVITDYKIAPLALKWAVEEMENRYKKFKDRAARDISTYNKKLSDDEERMPWIVIIIDELADLMMVSQNEVENYIMRIAQKARAAGIHLILATQRPSVNVITGTIKSNIPTRIAFSVSSGVDSRTILDESGAEKLLGRGDMLFLGSGMSVSLRGQGAYISDDEIERITTFVDVNNKKLPFLFAHEDLTASKDGYTDFDDDLFDDVCDYVLTQETISTSKIQRRFSVGFNRASRLTEMLEQIGLISEANGTKPRDVLMSRDEFEEFRDENN